MNIRIRTLLPETVRRVGLTLAALALAATSAFTYPNLTNVVELNGDNEPTDTITAKWTGVTYNTTINGEPVPGVPAGTPFTVPKFGEDVPSSVDRAHQWNGAAVDLPIPGYLLEGEYIMIGTDNRNNTNFMLQLYVAERSAVYLLIDNRCGDGSAGTPPFSTNSFDQWWVMEWVYTNGFQPLLRGYNRTSDPNAPDEVAYDEGSDGVGPGVNLNQWASIYYKIVDPGAPGVPAVITGDQYIGNNIYGVVVTPEVPKRPNLQAASMNGRVILSWAASAGTTNYVIRRGDVSGGPYTDIAAQATPGFTDYGVVNGQTYYYVVAAEGLFGSNVSLQVIGAPKLAPESLVATGGTNQIALSWTALGGASSYTVKRADASGGPFTSIASGITATSYVDESLPGGRLYYYIVSAALSGGGESANSDEASAITAPNMPAGLVAERFAATVIRLSWNTTDPVQPTTLVERSDNGTTFTQIAEVTDGSKRYYDVGLAANVTNYYRVRASNSTGFSGYTAVVSANTPSGGVNVNFGRNDYTGSPEYPVPGYLDDFGDAYADRGNGYSYGWDANLTGSGNWAKLASSPDLRYDTYISAYLPDPPVHVWEVELPNGYYRVHIVSGDPNSEASVYQWDVERNVSAAKTPTVGARWQDFLLTVNVQDGRMTITNGPSAITNKICFVDIYSTTPSISIIPGTLQVTGGHVSFDLQTVPGVTNIVEYKNSLTDPTWTTLTSFTGSDAIVPITDSGPLPASRLYRARAVIP